MATIDAAFRSLVTSAAAGAEGEAQAQSAGILKLITAGYRIESATACGDVIYYVLRRETP